jgi:hypothetical protein
MLRCSTGKTSGKASCMAIALFEPRRCRSPGHCITTMFWLRLSQCRCCVADAVTDDDPPNPPNCSMISRIVRILPLSGVGVAGRPYDVLLVLY